MLVRLRSRLTFANVVSLMALFVALGGGAYAAVSIPTNSVGAKQLKKNAVTSSKVKNSAVTSAKVKDHSLLAKDFKAGQLPAGANGQKGDTGAQGAQGAQGDPGSARAYAHVTRAAGGDFVLDATRSKNVVNVVLPDTGNTDRPCVILPASINAATAVAIGTVDAQNTDNSQTAEVQHRVGGEGPQGCSGNALALFLKRNGTGSVDTIAFNVMIP